MSEFEFIAVFVSFVMGLGVTQLLGGVGSIIHRRGLGEFDPIHGLWTANVFLILIINWWVTFQWSTVEVWNFELFLSLIVWALSLYLLTAILYPRHLADEGRYGEVFDVNRNWFFGVLMVSLLLDVVQTWLRGELFSPRAYLPFVTHYMVLAGIGLLVRSRRFHAVLAVWFLVTLVLWVFGARRLLA